MSVLWLLLAFDFARPSPPWPYNMTQPGFPTVEACEAAGDALMDQGRIGIYGCWALPAEQT